MNLFAYAGNNFVGRFPWQILHPFLFNYCFTKVSVCTDYSVFAVGILIIEQDFKE